MPSGGGGGGGGRGLQRATQLLWIKSAASSSASASASASSQRWRSPWLVSVPSFPEAASFRSRFPSRSIDKAHDDGRVLLLLRQFSTSGHVRSLRPSVVLHCEGSPISPSSPSDERDQDGESSTSQQIRSSWVQELRERRFMGGTLAGRSRPTLPSPIFTQTFDRSSGPGGQNVNKVNTKANVRLDLAAATSAAKDTRKSPLPLPIPKEVVRMVVERSRYYTASSHSLLISSMQFRTQEQNLTMAVDKLVEHMDEVASYDLKGQTSQEQRQRVRALMDKDKRRNKVIKDKRKSVKEGRRMRPSMYE